MKGTLNIILNQYKIKRIDVTKMICLMKKDKKSTKKNIRVILTKGIGNMLITKIKDKDKLKKNLSEYFYKNNIMIA